MNSFEVRGVPLLPVFRRMSADFSGLVKEVCSGLLKLSSLWDLPLKGGSLEVGLNSCEGRLEVGLDGCEGRLEVGLDGS